MRDGVAHSAQYLAYLSSMDWKFRRHQAIERAKNKCERCGAAGRLEVHHLNYARLGREEDADILVVCPQCHETEDRKREANTSDRMWSRRVDGWATKKYGEEWYENHDEDEVSELFEEWIDRRGDEW